MNTITLFIIGFVIYGLISGAAGKAGRRTKPEGFPRPEGRQTKAPGSLRELLEEWTREAQGGGRPEQRPPARKPVPAAGADRSYRSRSAEPYRSPEGASTEGMQGDEGRPGIEGTPGTEGSSRYGTGYAAASGGLAEAAPRPPEAAPAAPAVPLDSQALRQGVIWAEVLGRPRALKPFRGPRT